MSVQFMNTSVIIPFRDRGTDPLRAANLAYVLQWWEEYGQSPIVVDDGRERGAQFNRSAAYNRGVDSTDADVLVFAEADMIVDWSQIQRAVALAAEKPGLVVAFTEYRYLSPEDSLRVRSHRLDPAQAAPQWVMGHGRSIGAINVLSRHTYELVGGYDENFEGNWYDDDAMKIAFDICAGPTRWVAGPAYHLYHLPGHSGRHLTQADRTATARNKMRLSRYRAAATPERIRELVTGERR